jgi:hypothetical protein
MDNEHQAVKATEVIEISWPPTRAPRRGKSPTVLPDRRLTSAEASLRFRESRKVRLDAVVAGLADAQSKTDRLVNKSKPLLVLIAAGNAEAVGAFRALANKMCDHVDAGAALVLANVRPAGDQGKNIAEAKTSRMRAKYVYRQKQASAVNDGLMTAYEAPQALRLRLSEACVALLEFLVGGGKGRGGKTAGGLQKGADELASISAKAADILRKLVAAVVSDARLHGVAQVDADGRAVPIIPAPRKVKERPPVIEGAPRRRGRPWKSVG